MRSHSSPPTRGYEAAAWRLTSDCDDDAIVELCRGLHHEDPGPLPGDAGHIRHTLRTLRGEPWRGRAVALVLGGQVIGYALLVAFWSNQLGGEVCEVDELYVAPGFRGRGYGGALFGAIERGDVWPAPAVAIALGITPSNARARRLYERLGLVVAGVSMVKTLPGPASAGALPPAGSYGVE